nr:hypothetical protein [Tanacetum cinerariifolium]
MAPLTFADTQYLSKSDASEGFDQIVDFLNAHTIHAKRTTWNEFSCSMASSVISLATGGCIQTRRKIEAIDADEDITLVDVEKDEEVVAMDVEP